MTMDAMDARADDVEIIHALSTGPNLVALATQIRSTLIVSSQQSLRDRGLFEPYLQQLQPEHALELSSVVAGVWLPISLGTAHYQACERLALSHEQLLGIGHDVEQRLRGSILLNVVRGVGITPVTVLGVAPKFWTRTFVGSEVQLARLGPKDMRIMLAGFPFAQLSYNRITFRGILESLVASFCRHVRVKEAPECAGKATLGYRISWV